MIRSFLRFHALLLSLMTLDLAILATSARADELLVSDRATNRVLEFNPTSGAFDKVLVGQDPANLFSPSAMAIGFGGDLFVASQGTGKILRYDINTGARKELRQGAPCLPIWELPPARRACCTIRPIIDCSSASWETPIPPRCRF